VRFMGFATSMLTFPVMTWLYLGETIRLVDSRHRQEQHNGFRKSSNRRQD
jgi:hypothetical protein